MFSRDLQRRLETYFSAVGTNTNRTINMTTGLLILLQNVLLALGQIKALWDNGFGFIIEEIEAGTNEPNSNYAKEWWLAAQAIFYVYVAVMKAPLGTFYNLAVIDESTGTAELVTDAEGNIITPFRLFDPTTIPTYLEITAEQFAWREPDSYEEAAQDPEPTP